MQLCNSRRGFLAGSLALSVGVTLPVSAANSLAIPDVPMILSRKIVRELHDGEKVTVSREWQIHFTRQLNGFTVDGRQLSAKVEAPEKMREIARIEESRPTDGMFPISLTRDGMISRVGAVADTMYIAAAVRMAAEMIANLPRNHDEKTRMRHAIAQLQNASNSILDVMPPDLFFPA